jgi:predicted ribosomally synthesized peptide with SipW-like signal peptide
MKKILKSLVLLGLTAIAVFGASQAFFSDTETSTGNVFQAGAIDLKVDRYS